MYESQGPTGPASTMSRNKSQLSPLKQVKKKLIGTETTSKRFNERHSNGVNSSLDVIAEPSEAASIRR